MKDYVEKLLADLQDIEHDLTKGFAGYQVDPSWMTPMRIGEVDRKELIVTALSHLRAKIAELERKLYGS